MIGRTHAETEHGMSFFFLEVLWQVVKLSFTLLPFIRFILIRRHRWFFLVRNLSVSYGLAVNSFIFVLWNVLIFPTLNFLKRRLMMNSANNFADDRAYLNGILEIMKKTESELVARLDELRDQMKFINNAIRALSVYEHVNSTSEE